MGDLNFIEVFHFFMRTPMQRKYAIAWRIGGAASKENETSLLDCT